ncbi:MAG: hypothetical protein H0V09_00590 [Gemmatimonadetes bacterium]|nr:hypothetical protein [Gemmatimonadota bacterium]
MLPSSRIALALALTCGLAGVRPDAAAAQANALVSQAREVEAAVARIRELPFVHSVSVAVKDREAIRAYALGRLDREYSPEQFRAKSESMIAWGFVRRPFDLRPFYAELLAEQIGGYYDPFEGVFFIADWLPSLLQKPIMAHELTHALQDQHFDLKPFLRDVRGNDDASLAGAAIVEGEGLAVMIDYALGPVGMTFEDVPQLEALLDTQLVADSSSFRVYASAPAIVKQSLLFPYIHGLLFVRAAKERGGWPAVSALYDSRPASSEQILWPEKYFEERDAPTRVELPDVARALGRGWKRIDRNVLGELGYRVALEGLPGGAGVEAARGWDGDAYALYERNRGQTALVSVSVWDSEADAEDFERAWRSVLDRGGREHRIVRDGTRVRGVVDVPRGREERVLRSLKSAEIAR